jgi:cobalamin biosynthesis Mg chelatase CobN
MMNSSRYSELGAVLAVVTLLAVAAVPVAAVSVDGDAPGTAQVGEQQSTTFEVTDPFSDYEQWTLRAETQLTDVTWQVQTFDNAGNQVSEETLTGQEMTYQLQASSGVTRVEVSIEGTVPQASAFEWSYDPEQTITYASFEQAQEGGSSSVLSTFDTRPYTSASQEARTAISDAEAAIESAQSSGASVSGAEGDLEDAVEFYSTGNFEEATSNAEEAESAANNAASSAEQTQLLLYGGVALVLVLVVAGIGYWYLQQRDTYDKLG